MLRITLSALLLYISALVGFSQPGDTTHYKSKKLKPEEINFVSGYYVQNGNNSAVTGGIGNEHLTDLGTTIDVKLSRYDYLKRKHTWTAEIGFDAYSSASSDKIDPSTISSASSADRRFYPSLTYTRSDETKGSAFSITGSVSTEYDYLSKGIALGWSKSSKDRNREFNIKAQAFLDTWTIILPIELRSSSGKHGTEPRNSYSASFVLSQVINQRLQVSFMADVALQKGELATLYHRTYFTNGSHEVENLPDTRIKIPIGLRVNYFMGDRFIFRTLYRYYQDTWDLQAHSIELEPVIKLTPFFSVSPFYRYYTQREVKYFAPYAEHSPSEEFYTSDYDLSTLTSNMMGGGIRLAPPGGILNIPKLNAMELRYGHYQRSTGLISNILTLMLKIK